MQPETILKDVFHLQPGYAISIKNGRFSQWQYWNIPFNANDTAKNPIGYEEAKEQLRALFFDALKHHLISDVPLGVFLSGGIDSSLIVAAMQKLGSETKTYSMGFDVGGSLYNETQHAKQVAELYGTSHTEVILSEADILSDIKKIIYGIDQPSSDGLNSYVISKISRPHVTVALSGLGSDELFGGYTLFKFAQRLSSFYTITNKLPESVGKLSIQLDKRLPSSLQEKWHWRALVGIAGGYSDTATLYTLRNLNSLRQRKQLFNKCFVSPDEYSGSQYNQLLKQVFHTNSTDTIQELSFLELKCYMRNTLLRDADAMSMINSLEVRVPFLDHKLAEFVVKLPSSYKIDNQTKEIGKKILTDTFSDLLPSEIVHRKKMGFVFPLGIWMRTGKFRTLIQDTLTEKTVEDRGIFNYGELQKNMTAFFNSEDDSPRTYRSYLMIWMATQLELWMQMFL
ncbi:MAG: hypothetical protein HGB11_06255 [Chlorobiales bacterium]|nr:hypothetical protein [Chlorobiales bacterium]